MKQKLNLREELEFRKEIRQWFYGYSLTNNEIESVALWAFHQGYKKCLEDYSPCEE